ncbi:MAG TPA: HEAT repeat domain-containing protein, partial [Gemmataceae bacterium]|nr:HEAT repeat domain-containing protein [Gemmataceae bacterium]
DVPGLANLLTNPDPNVRRLAAELLPGVSEVPDGAVDPLAMALDDEDERVRVTAANALGVAGPKAGPAAEKLAGAIRKTYPLRYDERVGWDEGAEVAYWQALAQIGEPGVAALSGLLEHSNVIVRYYATLVLGEIGPPAKAAAAALQKRLSDQQEHGQVRLGAASALCRIGANTDEAAALVKQALDTPLARFAIDAIPRMGPAGKPLIPLALEKLTSDDPNARYAAVRLVGALEPDDVAKAVPELAKLVNDPEPLIRRRVGAVLEKLGPAAGPAAAALGKQIQSELDEVARDQYVDALIAMGPGAKPAAAVLVQLIDEPDLAQSMRLRVIAAAAVADPASPAVASAVVKASGDRDEAVRAAAASAIGKLNPLPADALAVLIKLAKSDPRYPPRLAAVRALAEAGPRAKAARADLETLTKGTMPGVALWAKVALAAVDGDVRTATGVIRAGLSDADGQVREAAAEALILIGPTPSDLPALTAMLKGPAGKAAAARAIGRLGPAAKEAVPRLSDLLEDRDSGARVAAAEALGQIGAPAATPAIPKLQAALKDPLVEPTARKALEKLGVKENRGKK